MGCSLAKADRHEAESSGAQQTRRFSWRMHRLHNKSVRMAAIRQREAELQQQLPPSSRRSSVANGQRGTHVVCPEPTLYDFCSPKRDGPEDADYFSQLDCQREQKRNEFEDYGTSPHLTLGAYDRLDFGLTPMENAQDAVF